MGQLDLASAAAEVGPEGKSHYEQSSVQDVVANICPDHDEQGSRQLKVQQPDCPALTSETVISL